MHTDPWSNDEEGIFALCRIHIYCNSMCRSKIAWWIRKRAELSIDEAARISGRSRRTILDWEDQKVTPRAETLLSFATDCGVALFPLLFTLTSHFEEAEWIEDRLIPPSDDLAASDSADAPEQAGTFKDS